MLNVTKLLHNNKIIHKSWVAKKVASKDWFKGFMKRHSNITIRESQSTSLVRAMSFNEKNVSVLQLMQLVEQYHQ